MQSMAQRYQRPDWVRRLNAMAGAVGGDPRAIVPLDPGSLIEAALAGDPLPAGDFGDPSWRRRFEDLTRALDRSTLHVVGRLLSRQELLRSLRTRFAMAREVLAHPEIEAAPIREPVIITGPARSGTTILFELLSLDPELRAPTAWKALHPLPRADEPHERAERLAWSECEQELWADVQPEFAAMHELRSDLPVECVTLTLPSFCGAHWSMVAQLGDFAPDMEQTFDYHRRTLQVMQHGLPEKRWLLKTPGHLMTLELLFATYPDAWLVQTHRDPSRTMPSTASITAMVQWMRTDHVDLPLLCSTIESIFSFAQNHVVELRASGALPQRFVDVHFRSMMSDPVVTLREAYATMGRELDPGHAEAITAYLRDKPQGKFGKHRYSPEEWGYDAETLRKNLRPYIEYFGIELES